MKGPILAMMMGMAMQAGASPWGIALGAEWSGHHPRFNPLLREAGVKWVRYFPEWNAMQPVPGEWKLDVADDFLASSKDHGIQVAGGFWYAAGWATTDGGTRRVPLKDMAHWRDYVTGMVKRYGNEVRWWEVWNEFNGSFSEGGTPEIYAEMVREAWKAAKAVDPQVKIGLSVANFDVGFLDAAIRKGAAGHFDYVCVHPYENLALLGDGGESGYLSMATSLRQMLAANGEAEDMPLWITETGVQSTIKANPQADAKQAEIFTKGYVLSLAQGFDKIFWFEARGPAYGEGTDHGILRHDWSKRPVYDEYRKLTESLGPEPEYFGWLDPDGAFGFVFRSGDDHRLVAWADGERMVKRGEREFALNRKPEVFGQLSAKLVSEARKNIDEPFPWGVDHAKVEQVACHLGATNREEGIRQVNPETTAVFHGLDSSWHRVEAGKGGESLYAYFRVDAGYVPFGVKELDITVVAKRLPSGERAGFGLTYESATGYKGAGSWWTIPEGDEWSEQTWRVSDANFAGGWGWNFRTDASGSPADFLLREVRVKKAR